MPKQIYRILDSLSPSDMKLTGLPRKPDGLYNLSFNEYGQLEKRKGYEKYNATTLSADHKIVGMHRFYKQDTSTKEFLVVCNTTIYKLSETTPFGGTSIIGSTSLTADKQTFFANYYNTCYVVNGANGVYKYDGTNFRTTGIAVPAAAPTGTSPAGGSLSTGNYKVRYTYVDENGYEGNGSPASTDIASTASDKITLAIVVSSDAKVTKRRIYRTTVNGAMYYYDKEVTNNTDITVDLTQADTALSLNSVLEADHDAPPSTAHLISKRRSRLILADGDTFYISYIADVEYFPVDWIIYTGARQKITGLVEQQETMPIFTEDSIERLVGQDEDNFEFQNAYSVEGCIAMRSLVNCNNLLVFLGCDGIYYFDGTSAKIINVPLSEYVKDNINPTYASLSAGAYFDNKYLLSYPKGESTVPNETVYVDFRTNVIGIYNLGFSCYSRWDHGTDGIQLYGGSNTEGRVYKIGIALTDDGNPITSYDDICPLDLGIPERQKNFYSIYVKCITTGGTALRVYYNVDNLTEAYVDITMTANTEKWYRLRLPSGVRGRAISLRPYVSDSYQVTICGYMFEYDVEAGEM